MIESTPRSIIDPSNAANALNRVYKSLSNIGPTESQQIVFYNLLHILSGPSTAPTSIRDQVCINTNHKDYTKSTLYTNKPDTQLKSIHSLKGMTESTMATPTFGPSKESDYSTNSHFEGKPNYFKYNQSSHNATTKASNFEYKYPSSYLPNPSGKGSVFASGGSQDEYYESKLQHILHIMNNAETDANKSPIPRQSRASSSESADIFSSAMFSLRCKERKYYEICCLFFISICGRVLQYANRILTPFISKIDRLSVQYWNDWSHCENVTVLHTVLFICVVLPLIAIGLGFYAVLWGLLFMVRLLLSNVPSRVKQQLI